MKKADRILVHILFLLVLTVSALSHDLPMVEPEAVGLSTERISRIDKVMETHVAQQEIAGGVTLLARHGKIAHLGVYGMMDVEAEKPMTPDTIFRIASMTKPITSVAVMMLNGGKLDGVRLLSRKTVALMTLNQLANMDVDLGFGLGFSVVRDESDLNEVGSVGRFGWSGFFFTSFFIDPQEQMIGIFMCQLHPSGDLDLGEKIRILSYQAIAD